MALAFAPSKLRKRFHFAVGVILAHKIKKQLEMQELHYCYFNN